MTPELIEGDSFYLVVADRMNVPSFFIISVITVSFRLYPSTENYGAIKRRLGTTISVYHSIRHITLHCLVETT